MREVTGRKMGEVRIESGSTRSSGCKGRPCRGNKRTWCSVDGPSFGCQSRCLLLVIVLVVVVLVVILVFVLAIVTWCGGRGRDSIEESLCGSGSNTDESLRSCSSSCRLRAG